MIHGYASLPHYAAHITPILRALPPEVRGIMWGPRAGLAWGPELPPEVARPGPDWMIVAGLPDAQRIDYHHRLVYVEHGAGQTYVGLEDHGSYSGGLHTGFDVALYLAPNEQVADRWRARGSQAAAIGCPRLDVHAARSHAAPGKPRAPRVAFAWHWLCELAPETFSAWPAYELAMPDIVDKLRAEGIVVIGHAHPRLAGRMNRWWADHGIPRLDDLDEVLHHADVLVADNTSALYEAAAVGLSTVVLNAPWYRRNVEHGLRFWSHVPGPQVDGPDEVVAVVLRAVTEPEWGRALRESAAEHVYCVPIGQSAQAAADAIMEVYR